MAKSGDSGPLWCRLSCVHGKCALFRHSYRAREGLRLFGWNHMNLMAIRRALPRRFGVVMLEPKKLPVVVALASKIPLP